MTALDPDKLWWVHWRAYGDVCGRCLYPFKTEVAVDLMEKAAAVYGKQNVWMEEAEIAKAEPEGM